MAAAQLGARSGLGCPLTRGSCYSGMVNSSPQKLLSTEDKGKQALPAGPGSPPLAFPRNTAEVEKQPVSEPRAVQTNPWCSTHNNNGFVRRPQQPD